MTRKMGEDVGGRTAEPWEEEVPSDTTGRAHYTGGRQGGMLALLISQAVARD